MIEPTREASVSPPERCRARKLISASSSCATPWTCRTTRVTSRPEEDRETGDRREGEQHAADVRPDGVALAGQRRQPPADPAGLLVENREREDRLARAAGGHAGAGSRGDLGRHGCIAFVRGYRGACRATECFSSCANWKPRRRRGRTRSRPLPMPFLADLLVALAAALAHLPGGSLVRRLAERAGPARRGRRARGR